MPSVFPHGMTFIQEKLGVPTVMHNRQWSSKSDYIKNEHFEWYESKCCAIPKEQKVDMTTIFLRDAYQQRRVQMAEM